MCGIVGYYNYNVSRDLQYILTVLFKGLHRLEYRGYDSAGICVDLVQAGLANGLDANGGTIPDQHCTHHDQPIVIKKEGKIDILETHAYETLAKTKVDLSCNLSQHVGIAHTRWATHGPPSSVNSHPQVSDTANQFIVVHNGIITNFKPLKEFLIKQGEVFISDTDTEVIPKLCKYVYSRLTEKIPFPKLVMEVLKKLEGAYALLVKSTHYPGELVACKRGSPLILGVKEAADMRTSSFNRLRDYDDRRYRSAAMECWLASDASAVVEYTKKVIVLEDNDVVHVVGAGYGIYNTLQEDVEEAVPRDVLNLQLEVEEIMKNGYDHYMQKEIHEQPDAILQTMRGRVQFGKVANSDAYTTPRIKLGGMVEHARTIRSARRIMFIACGTSYHACLAARSTMEELVEVPVVLELASDLLDRRCPIFRDDTCVFVSQSGETADTLQALRYAERLGALCVGITNTVGSAISRATTCGVHQNAGYEIGVASTKAYTSQIICITMMALALSEDSIAKRPRRNLIIDELGLLPDKLREAMTLDEQMKDLAQQLVNEQSLLFFARGYNYATALEAALKMKEVALIHSEGILAGEMKHGPLALVDEHLPIIVVATRDGMIDKMESVLQQLLARGARLVVLANKGDAMLPGLRDAGCQIIEVPHTVDALQPVINIVPLQLLAYHLTVLRGHNVDQPRNLAKSVTVSEESHRDDAPRRR